MGKKKSVEDAKVAIRKGLKVTNTSAISNQATGFRNLMKYRAFEQCKRARIAAPLGSICIHTYIYTHMYIYIYVYIHMCTPTYV